MTTHKTLTAQTPGAIRVAIDIAQGKVSIRSSPDVERATVTVSTEDSAGAAADAVNATRISEHNATLELTVPDADGREAHSHSFHSARHTVSGITSGSVFQSTTFMQVGSGNVQVLDGSENATFTQTGFGNVQIVDDSIYVNNREIVRDGVVVVPQGTRVGGVPGGLRVDIQLPPGSEIDLTSTDKIALLLDGTFDRLTAHLARGSVDAEQVVVGTATVNTGVGDIAFGQADDSASLTTAKGNITVGSFTGGTLTATSVKGDLAVRAAAHVRPGAVTLKTVKGDIDTWGLDSLPHISLSATTVSGSVNRR